MTVNKIYNIEVIMALRAVRRKHHEHTHEFSLFQQ